MVRDKSIPIRVYYALFIICLLGVLIGVGLIAKTALNDNYASTQGIIMEVRNKVDTNGSKKTSRAKMIEFEYIVDDLVYRDEQRTLIPFRDKGDVVTVLYLKENPDETVNNFSIESGIVTMFILSIFGGFMFSVIISDIKEKRIANDEG